MSRGTGHGKIQKARRHAGGYLKQSGGEAKNADWDVFREEGPAGRGQTSPGRGGDVSLELARCRLSPPIAGDPR